MERLRPERLTQVGIRALCGVERACLRSNERIATFTDHELQAALADGQTWSSLCERIVETLPANVYVTFDIDGLDPAYCPEHRHARYPAARATRRRCCCCTGVRESGRRICGFDLVEGRRTGARRADRGAPPVHVVRIGEGAAVSVEVRAGTRARPARGSPLPHAQRPPVAVSPVIASTRHARSGADAVAGATTRGCPDRGGAPGDGEENRHAP